MQGPGSPPDVVRFGVFEVDLRSGELRKTGLRVKIQEQPFQVLSMLLEHPGEMVTREQLRKQLWPADTFVDFEHGLNAAINKLREALGDSADNPRFVETLPRRGYRFIALVETVAALHERRLLEAKRLPAVTDGRYSNLRLAGLALGIVAVLLAPLIAFNLAGLRDRVLRSVGAIHESPLQIRSIAVLPLENLSHDPEQEYFADGMTDELITNLSKISALRVISRTSVMRYKQTKKPLPEIARELNVDAVVEGTVLRSGGRVRITANVVHAPTDRHLWAESYERDLRDVLTLQSEVAQAIAREVQAKLTPLEQARLATARPVDPESYQLYIYGRYHAAKMTFEGFTKGIEYFQQAIEKDPGNALAYAGLADCYGYGGGGFAYVPTKDAFPKARAAALRALEIDDTLAEAHVSLSGIMDDWSGAERELKRAIQLNPNSAGAHTGYMGHLASIGRFEQAVAEGRLAQRLDPLSPGVVATIGWTYMINRHYDEALPYLQKALELDPNLPYNRTNLAQTYAFMGRHTQALAECDKLKEYTDPAEHQLEAGEVGYVYAVSGRGAEARRILEGFKKVAKTRYVDAYKVAEVYAGLGEKDQALEWLQRAYQERSGSMYMLKMYPTWDPLRSDPRFQDLLRRMNFPP